MSNGRFTFANLLPKAWPEGSTPEGGSPDPAAVDPDSGVNLGEHQDAPAERRETGAQPAPQSAPSLSEDHFVAAGARAKAEERARWDKIMSSEAASARLPLAVYLAAHTDMGAQQVIEALARSPAIPTASAFDRAMRTLGNPDVGEDARPASEPKGDEAVATRMIRHYAAATGHKVTRQ